MSAADLLLRTEGTCKYLCALTPPARYLIWPPDARPISLSLIFPSSLAADARNWPDISTTAPPPFVRFGLVSTTGSARREQFFRLRISDVASMGEEQGEQVGNPTFFLWNRASQHYKP